MFRVDRSQNRISRLVQKRFGDLGLRERDHLQEWIVHQPDALGEELLIIQKEFDRFDDTRERLDLLALDKSGNLVVIENKLDDSGRDVTWQALKYTAYVSVLKNEQIVGLYQDYLNRYEPGGATAAQRICEFLGKDGIEEAALNPGLGQRVIFVAANFRKEVTATVLWLISRGIKAQCFRVVPFEFDEQLFIDLQQIIPPPEAASYMIGLSSKEIDEDAARGENKRRHELRQAFWSALLEKFKQQGQSLFSNISPSREHWLSTGSGLRSCIYQLIFSKDECRVELILARASKSENKWLFDKLHERQDQIENVFGDPLNWRRMDDNKQSVICFAKDFDGFDKANWPEMMDWLSEHIQRFQRAFQPHLDELGKSVRNIDDAGAEGGGE